MREERTGVIKHNEFDSDTVGLMLQHAYTGEYGITKRPFPLSFLERESQHEDMEQVIRETEKEKAEKEEAVRKSRNESGNEIGSSDGVESESLAAAAAVAAVATDDGTVADDGGLLIDALNTLSLSDQNTDSTQSGETVRERQQFHPAFTPISNCPIPLGSSQPGIIDQLVTHARVYGLANYYDMERLRDYSRNKFSKIVDQRRVDLRSEHTLRSFIDVVKEIGARTSNSNDSLRMSFLKLIMEHATDLCTNADFIKDLGDSGLCELAADMLREVALSLERDRHFHIDRRKNLMTLHTRMTEKEEFWEDCAPGWKRGYR